MFRNNHPNNSLLYTKAMTFIQKNTAIANFLEQIPNDSSHFEKVNILKNAIDKEQSGDDIFKDENCLMYLLFLIKNNQIEENQALTLLTYLMGLKSNYNIEIIHINDDKNKNFKEKYIDELIKKTKPININLDKDKLNVEISKLTGMDAWVMIIKHPNSSKEIEFLDQLFEGHAALLQAKELKSILTFDDKTNRYGLPSIAIINQFILQFNPHPIRYYPIFGIISLETLLRLHLLGYHPLQLHGGVFVKKNLEIAHGKSFTPFTILIHDLYHAYSGSLLNNEEHVYLYHSLIPALSLQIETLIKKDSNCKNTAFVAILKKLLDSLIDMDIGLHAHRRFSKRNNDSQTLFNEWLTANFIHLSKGCYVQDLDLNTVIKFYYNLFTSTSISPAAVNDLSKIDLFAPIAKAVKDCISVKNKLVNMKALEAFFNDNNGWFPGFIVLLKNSKTAKEFLFNLQLQKKLYYELMKYGFIYISGFSTFTPEDFKEIKKLTLDVANNPNAANTMSLSKLK